MTRTPPRTGLRRCVAWLRSATAAAAAVLFLFAARAAPAADPVEDVAIAIVVSHSGTGVSAARGGVPFSERLALLDPSRLCVRRIEADGEWLPAEWTVLSRYGGLADDPRRPIRWAVLEFRAPVDGAYVVRAVPAASARAVARVGAATAQTTAATIRVDPTWLRAAGVIDGSPQDARPLPNASLEAARERLMALRRCVAYDTVPPAVPPPMDLPGALLRAWLRDGRRDALDAALVAFRDATAAPVRTLLLGAAVTGDLSLVERARARADAAAAAPEAGRDTPADATARAADLFAFAEFTGVRRFHDAARRAWDTARARAESDDTQITTADTTRVATHLVEIHAGTRDPRALSMLLRTVTALRERRIGGGTSDGAGGYTPLHLAWAHWGDMSSVNLDTSVGALLPLADVFAYAARETGEPTLRDAARRAFRDGVLLLGAPGRSVLSPDWDAAAALATARGLGEVAWALGAGDAYLAFEDASSNRDEAAVVALQDDAWFEARRIAGAAHPAAEPPAHLPPTDRTPTAPATAPPVAPDRSEDVAPPATTAAPLPAEADDAAAAFDGDWAAHRAADAFGGACRTTTSRTAHATFTVACGDGARRRLYVRWPSVAGAATDARFEVHDAAGQTTYVVDQSRDAGRWRLVGTVTPRAGESLVVRLRAGPSGGVLVVDGIRLEPVPAPSTGPAAR